MVTAYSKTRAAAVLSDEALEITPAARVAVSISGINRGLNGATLLVDCVAILCN